MCPHTPKGYQGRVHGRQALLPACKLMCARNSGVIFDNPLII